MEENVHLWGQRVCGTSLYLQLNFAVSLKLFWEKVLKGKSERKKEKLLLRKDNFHLQLLLFRVVPLEKCQPSPCCETLFCLGRGEHLVQPCFITQLPPVSPDPPAIGKAGTPESPQPVIQSRAPLGAGSVCAEEICTFGGHSPDPTSHGHFSSERVLEFGLLLFLKAWFTQPSGKGMVSY